MNIEVEVISEEIVKPSSQTPPHLRHYHLSFPDQITPQVNNSMVYFFDGDDAANHLNINDASDRLKRSLSQVLTHYYPLAGRLINKSFVDCNDKGVPYIETRVKCHLSHVIDNPSPDDVSKLLPFEMDEAVDILLGVQFNVNVFEHGGIAIGICICHKVADALLYFQFIKSWAAMARGEPEQIRTHFQSSTLFPAKDLLGFDPDSYIAKEKIICKRFTFEASIIESLRAKYSKNILEGLKLPSRVEVLSTFIWIRFMAATKEKGSEKTHLVGWSANLRPRMEPPLPEYAFGNYYWVIRTLPTLDEKAECNDLGRKFREELNKIDKNFLVKLQEGEEWNTQQINRDDIVSFGFTSLCRFPVYDVDFGWGNPTWAGPPVWKFKNVVTFKDTRSGGGIEAYVSLTEEDMAKLEDDEEFLSHVSTMGLK